MFGDGSTLQWGWREVSGCLAAPVEKCFTGIL